MPISFSGCDAAMDNPSHSSGGHAMNRSLYARNSIHIHLFLCVLLATAVLFPISVQGQQSRNETIQGILEKFGTRLSKSGLLDAFGRQNSSQENAKVGLDATQAKNLGQISGDFFRELASNGLSMQDVMQFKAETKQVNMAAGEDPLFAGKQFWDAKFLNVERALMMGRAETIQTVWKQTIIDFYNSNPEFVCVKGEDGKGAGSPAVWGEMDIGSWVKMALKGLSFEADIDFSSIASIAEANEAIKNLFSENLARASGYPAEEVQRVMDAVLTAHGQAGAEVFVGEWGKAFAEIDMLKRSNWKEIVLVKDASGKVIDIQFKVKSGAQMFWETAFRTGKEVEFPKVTADHEPMISMEMLRHLVHDIEHSESFSRGDKIIKMLKYVERSYFMNKKATAGSAWDPYSSNDPSLAQLADAIIKIKSDSKASPQEIQERIANELTKVAGELNAGNVDELVTQMIDRAKTAITANAEAGLSNRLQKICETVSDVERQKSLDKLWDQMSEEIKALNENGQTPPENINKLLDLAMQLREGGASAMLAEAELAFRKLLNEVYRLPATAVEILCSYPQIAKLRAYCEEKFKWSSEKIDGFIKQARQKYPRMSAFYDGFVEFNEKCNETGAGSKLLNASQWADMGFSVYEAYLSKTDKNEALKAAAEQLATLGIQMQWPLAGIPVSVYTSLSQGSPKPLIWAIGFYYFPGVAQIWTVGANLQRLDAQWREKAFYDELGKMLECTEYDQAGKISQFKILGPGGTVEEKADVSPPGNRPRIVEIFEQPGSPFASSRNFNYWRLLIPDKQFERFTYNTKMQRLRQYFPNSDEIRFWTIMLENQEASQQADDQFNVQRMEMLDQMQEKLRGAIWSAMADALESGVAASSDPKVAAWKKKIKEIEDDLGLGDSTLGKDKGLQSRIDREITLATGLVTQIIAGDNIYAVGQIYEKHINGYEKIRKIRDDIFKIWLNPFQADGSKILSDPLKLILNGSSKQSAPVLKGVLEKDLAVAQRCQDAHASRARKITSDLTQALKRSPDPAKDAAHLKTLGQIGFEWEHLVDDTPEREGNPTDDGVLAEMSARNKVYHEYLGALRAGSTLNIAGKREAKVDEAIPLSVSLQSDSEQIKSGIRVTWSDGGHSLGSSESVEFSSSVRGSHQIRLIATYQFQGRSIAIGQIDHTINVVEKPDENSEKEKAAAAELERRKNAEREKARAEEAARQKAAAEEAARRKAEAEKAAQFKKFSELTQPEKNGLFSCLCRYSCGGPGCMYNEPVDKDPGGVLACPRVGRPPCIWGEWGCNYGYFRTTGEDIKSCYTGSKVIYDPLESERDIREANKKSSLPLKATLSPDAKPIRAQYGDIVKITANAEGGIPGYTYSWAGNGEGKDNGFTFINTRKSGSYSVSVSVSDSYGTSASASTTIVVEAISVKVERVSPTTGSVTVGGKAQFKATVMSGAREASGEFNILWQPHPEIEFEPYEKSATTTATFRKPGAFSIYVQALKKDGAVYATIGESNQVTIAVANPSWKLDYNPLEPLIGQEVKATLNPDAGPNAPAPDMKEMNFRWQLPANARQKGTSPDDREITFYLTDGKPAQISALASTKYDNQNLGGAGKSIKAKSYQLSIAGPRPRQEFQIWKCETQLGGAPSCGMRKVENQFAVDQEILFSVSSAPKPEKPVTYAWTLGPDGCTLRSDGGSDTSIACNSAGGYSVKATAKIDGLEIGSASANVSVSISQADISRSNKAKDAYEKLQKAKELASQDKLDEAIQAANEALKLDPANTEASALANKWKLAKNSKDSSAQNALKSNQGAQPALNPAAGSRDDANRAAQVKACLDRGQDFFNRKDYAGAAAAATEAIKLDPKNSEAFRLRARAQREAGAIPAAISDFTSAIGLKPDDSSSYNGRGMARKQSKDMAGAIGDFNKAIELDPRNASAYINRANLKSEQGDQTGAIADNNQASTLAPNDPIPLNNRAVAKEKMGDLAGAAADYQKALQLKPDYELAQKNLSRLKEKMQQSSAGSRSSSQTTSAAGSSTSYYHVDLRSCGGKKEAPHSVKGIEIDDSSWIRLKSTDENRLQLRIPLSSPVSARAVAIVSNLDDATYLPQGGTIARMTVVTTSGRRSFDIKAGIHSAEWNANANPRHRRDIEGALSADHYLAVFSLPSLESVTELALDYVESNVERWAGHAPGFCLRGITLLANGAPLAAGNGNQPVPVQKTTITSTGQAPAAGEQRIYYNGNNGGVMNSPSAATTFRTDQPWLVTYIMAYHYNGGRGQTPGTIGLRHQDGTMYGPWQVSGRPSQGSQTNLYWECRPNVVIKPGMYTVIDSHPLSWSWNSESGGGMVEIKGALK
jgi:tetratricopeptide (TPR) repeat protein